MQRTTLGVVVALLVGLLAAPFASAASDGERRQMIGESYLKAFARKPQDGEFNYWSGRTDWRSVADLVNLHRSYIQANDSARTEVIRNSYQFAFGRPGSDGEVNYWKGRHDWTIADDLVNLHRNYIRASDQVADEIVTRAFNHLMRRNPTAKEASNWRSRVRNEGFVYIDLFARLLGQGIMESAKQR